MKYAEQYNLETISLHHRRVYYIILVGMGMTLLFSILDYIVAPDLFNEFLFYRLTVCVLGGTLLVVNASYATQGKELVIGFLGYLCVGIAVVVMVIRMGGIPAPYYVGLIVTMTIYTAIAPLTAGQTLVAGFALVGCYFVSILLFTTIQPDMLVEFFNSLFFLTCFVFIAATQSWAESSARKQEFLLRMKENELNDELTRYADILEAEVEKRTKEQEISEERYHLLFNSIADAVVLVNEQGYIVQCNTCFQRCFLEEPNSQTSLFDFVALEDIIEVQHHLLDTITTGEPVFAFKISLFAKDTTPLDVEISGTRLLREGKCIGVQLVIRDITIRKQLEKRLVTSLLKVKRTESATILALAKLSEYRDFTPGNHLERIREYCKIIGNALSHQPELETVITPAYLHDLYHAAILHDVGKVSFPDSIINKSTPLTKEEQAVIRRHTLVGGDVIKSMEEESQGSGFLSMAKVIAYFHHERWDGTGFPHGLQQTEIPLAARIMAVADAYEEMTADNREGSSLSHPEATQKIIAGSGHQFDPMIVDAFTASSDEIDIIQRTLAERSEQEVMCSNCPDSH